MLSRLASYLLTGFLDLIYPRNCLVTGKPLDGGNYRFLSEEGVEKLNFIPASYACQKCGAPLVQKILNPNLDEQEEPHFCFDCENRSIELQFGRSRSVLVLDEFSANIVYSLKYWNHPAVVNDMVKLAARERIFKDYLRGAILVPVPLFSKRLRQRGYNQSQIWAKALAKEFESSRVEDLLVRTRDTGTQTQLDAEKRRKNIAGAFALKPKARLNPLAHYILVDDVFTTGSTLSECAACLREKGALHIDAITFAHG